MENGNLRSGDGQQAQAGTGPRGHPLVGVVIVLTAEVLVAFTDAQKVDTDAHISTFTKHLSIITRKVDQKQSSMVI